VNAEGKRFLDEGADYRNYTYAKYGAEILRQPGGVAFQLFDAQTKPLLRADEYEGSDVSRHEAATIRELAESMGVSPDALERTVSEFNAAVQDAGFDPGVKDGKGTDGITPPKSNWALPLNSPPYLAFGVCCGITFTFGGLRIAPTGQVLDEADVPIPGLYACGEIIGGLFYYNYPGGSGLTAGTVFGRRSGYHAAGYSAYLDSSTRALERIR
jgi:tricarballylate dehydrogenase